MSNAKPSPSFTPRSREDWRNWLEQHHATEIEVWLVFFKQGSGKANLTYDDAVEEAICFGWIDGIRKSLDTERYVHRFSPRKPESRWSATNIRRAERLMEHGKIRPSGARTIEQARKNGRWENPVKAPGKFEMPPEFLKCLEQNRRAGEFFEQLAPSYQQQYIAWIVTAKRQETRERRLSEALALLEQSKKLGMR